MLQMVLGEEVAHPHLPMEGGPQQPTLLLLQEPTDITTETGLAVQGTKGTSILIGNLLAISEMAWHLVVTIIL